LLLLLLLLVSADVVCRQRSSPRFLSFTVCLTLLAQVRDTVKKQQQAKYKMIEDISGGVCVLSSTENRAPLQCCCCFVGVDGATGT